MNLFSVITCAINVIVYYFIVRFAFGFVMSVCSPKDQDWVGVTFGRFEKLLRHLRDTLYRKLSNPKITEVTYHVDKFEDVLEVVDHDEVIEKDDIKLDFVKDE